MSDLDESRGRVELKVLLIGRRHSSACESIRSFTECFEQVEYVDEQSFDSFGGLLNSLNSLSHDLILMPNPYGNKRRLLLYWKLRKINFPVLVFDRGALPGSWFFDKGFNADSPTYRALQWDHALSEDHQAKVKDYLLTYRSGNTALERQGGREGGLKLKERLGLSKRRVLFVPFQCPKDATVKYFSGSVVDLGDFAKKIELIQSELDRLGGGWTVICKKHPLANAKMSVRSLRYVDDDTNVDDLLELSDAVCLVNSGVGVLSMLWGKPVYHFGEVFYSHPCLNRRVHDAHELVHSLLKSPVVFDPEVRDRFIYHLIERVYSFGDFSSELVIEGNSYRNIIRDILFHRIVIPDVHKLSFGGRLI